jgi:hypothetical protein
MKKHIVLQVAAVVCGLFWLTAPASSQNAPSNTASESESSTSNYLFIMLAEDLG